MLQPQPVQGIAMFSLTDFYGMDDPRYMDVFVEFGEDREQITDMIATAILQYKTSTLDELKEMVFLKLGYMGFDSEEDTFYERTFGLLQWIASRLSKLLPEENLELVLAMEDADWVNVIYKSYPEAIWSRSPTALISKPYSPVSIGL